MGNFKNADRLDSASLVKARQCRARGLPSPGFYAAGEKSPCRQARIDTQIVLRTMRIPPLAKFAAGASPLPYSAVRKRSVYSKKQRKQTRFLCFRSLFLSPEGRQRRTKLVFLHNISSPIKYDKISSTVQQGRPPQAAQYKYHITSFILCKFAGYPNLSPSFYGSSHLAKGPDRWYHKATTKE